MNKSVSKPDLIEFFSAECDTYSFLHPGSTCIAGISGGVDSMVLLWLLIKTGKYRVIVAHINYGMRGSDSDSDEQLVRSVCKQNKIIFEVYRAREQEKSYPQGNFQDQARNIRRQFLMSTMNKHHADAIFLAHHKDDQIETVFQKILRGAAADKWTGMKSLDLPWVRPLLEITKNELVSFAEEHKIPYRTDTSNLESCYSRNVLRNEVFPLFEKACPGWQENIIRIIRSGHLHGHMLDYIAGQVTDSGMLRRDSWLLLPTELRIPVARCWIQQGAGYTGWSRGEVERLSDLEHLQTGRTIPFDRFDIKRDRDVFVIVGDSPSFISHELSLSQLSNEMITCAGIHFSENRYDPGLSAGFLQLNRNALPEKLLLRTWQKGDRIQPFGMKGTQSLADHLTNRKISASQKKHTLALVSFDGKVHAVIFPHYLDSGEAGTIADHARCHKKGQRVLLIKKTDHLP